MTSIQVPYSVAAALPSLAILDITNDVARAIVDSGVDHGIAYVSPASGRTVVRVNEREGGFFEDFEELLERLVPSETRDREALISLLLGPVGDQVPFVHGRLQLGAWQRILLLALEGGEPSWRLTIVG
ncbi:MAG: YjbQ family protein [Gaiellaceae bacterium]